MSIEKLYQPSPEENMTEYLKSLKEKYDNELNRLNSDNDYRKSVQRYYENKEELDKDRRREMLERGGLEDKIADSMKVIEEEKIKEIIVDREDVEFGNLVHKSSEIFFIDKGGSKLYPGTYGLSKNSACFWNGKAYPCTGSLNFFDDEENMEQTLVKLRGEGISAKHRYIDNPEEYREFDKLEPVYLVNAIGELIAVNDMDVQNIINEIDKRKETL